MEDLIKIITDKHEDIIRCHGEPSYVFANKGRGINGVQSRFLIYTEEPNNNHDTNNCILKCYFTLFGLVNACGLDERYGLSEETAVKALYESIKRNAKKKETLERLEKDYMAFCKERNV